MGKLKRPIQIKFRVNEQEYNLIKERMNDCKIRNMARFLRQMSLHGCIIITDYTELKERNYELHKIGVNINQIAKKANETDNIYSSDIELLKEMMDYIWQSQKYILSDEP